MSELDDQIAAIEREESRLIFPGFSHADAWRLGSILMELAVTRSLGIAIDITRGEQQVFHAATEGSSAGNDLWIARKVRSARVLNSSTLLLRLKAEQSGRDFATWLDPASYAIAGGCFPIRVGGGAIVGTVTVSGLRDTEDHALAVEAVELFLNSRQ